MTPPPPPPHTHTPPPLFSFLKAIQCLAVAFNFGSKCGTKDRHWCEQNVVFNVLIRPPILDSLRRLHPLSPEEALRTSRWGVGELITEMPTFSPGVLAHLSQRLMCELIVYQSLRRPSGVFSSVLNFKHLLFWNHRANLIQISYGDSLRRGNKCLYKWSWSHDQDGRHAHIW